jgi:sigma-B regulation protein RsbU (phosphoserine phosphatase)
VKRVNANSCEEVDAEGLIIGVKPSVLFDELCVVLMMGFLLVFYNDGLSEATGPGGEMFGNDRICRHLENIGHLSAKEIVASFYTALYNFSGTRALQDDVSIVALKIL